MSAEDRFKKSVVTTLSKRAANRCSNPDCSCVTSGPTETATGSVNVGEAAHIFGANAGSARYNAEMTAAERSAITNAIWLCGNCHKIVDDDPVTYPAGLLFEWQRDHEIHMAEIVGKAGAELRRRYQTRHLEEFGRLSYLAERIILEKGKYWEYRLTAEVLRFEMFPVLQKWAALKRGVYMKSNYLVSSKEFIPWFQTRLSEMSQICTAFSELANFEFQTAWGDPGIAGSDIAIVNTCRLFSSMCSSALDWEEAVRFAVVDKHFKEVNALFFGIGGGFIDEAAKFPQSLSEIFSETPTLGVHELTLTITVPEGWAEEMELKMETAVQKLIDDAE